MKNFRAFLLILPFILNHRSLAQASFCVDCLSIRVGPAIKVLGPTNDSQGVNDIPLSTVKIGTTVHAYPAEGRTRHMTGSNVTNLSLVAEPPTALCKGTPPCPGSGGTFDQRAVFVSKVVNGASGVYGWYYAEAPADFQDPIAFPEGRFVRTVAYMESNDGGVTFTKPNYDQNPVLTFPDNHAMQVSGADSIATVQRGTFQYAYFVNSSFGGVAVARSLIADQGRPGTWFKWNNGAFTSPGIDGPATGLPLSPRSEFGASVYTGSTPSAVTLVFSQQDWDGLRLSFSTDNTSFTTMSQELLLSSFSPFPDPEPGEPARGERIVYPSMSALDGGESWSSTVYLFYVYVPPAGSTTNQRYLVRRQVDVTLQQSVQPQQVRVAFSRYYSPSRIDHWVTTSLPTVFNGAADYGLEATLGYLFTKQIPGTHKLEDCVIEAWEPDDYMVSTSCVAENTKFLRTLGYAWDTQQPNTIPIYRCYWWTTPNHSRANHFISTDANCEGLISEGLMGYIPQS